MNQFQSIGEVFSALKRRFFLILAAAALGSIASVYMALKTEKLYQAVAVVQIEGAEISDSLGGQGSASSDAALRVRLIEQRLMSRDNLEAVIEKLGVYAGEDGFTLSDKVVALREAVTVEQILTAQQAWQPNPMPSGLTIMAQSNDPQMAADLANEFMANVIAFSRERTASRAQNTLSFYLQEEARTKAQLDALSDELAALKTENADALPAGQAELRKQLTDLRDAELKVEQEIVSLQSNSARQRQGLVEQQVGLLNDQKSLLNTRMAEIEAKLLAAPAVERDIAAKERDLQALQSQYAALNVRKAEAEMGQILDDRQQGGRFDVLESAITPEDPISRSRKKVAMMGFVASVIGGLGLALALEMLNPVIRSSAQMERSIGLRPVIEIPTIQSKADKRRIVWTRVLGLLAVLASAGVALRIAQDKMGGLTFLPWVAADQN
ncbi:GumC family protein [Pseudoprimorskyibacter insulae]|uniref:Polysaccharide chain length determinant N-terminal domain-containing protein n=1 Tax=Pseudoprimorskyibacter insulae TaxID=1695997 RepID=A0A2R8AU99_9RHOB|nr:Wzz/FepE/Etk N-terminal domain-containing protein [Pseudoprimorskyibacter insulae]SPF79477.1 hypothetical protein PRI8871_01273 [Pseudoprimorskyibacter insulae]